MFRPAGLVLLPTVLFLVSQAAVGADGEASPLGAGMDVKVTFHISVVTCPDDVFQRMHEFSQHLQGNRGSPKIAEILRLVTPLLDSLAGTPKTPLETAADLDPDQFKCFMSAIQGDARSNAIPVPELTLSSGQAVTIRLPDQNYCSPEVGLVVRLGDQDVSIPGRGGIEPETTFTVEPVVSGDLRQIRLRLQMTHIERTRARQMVEVIQRPGQGGPVEPTVRVTTENNQPLFDTTRLDQTRTLPVGHSLVFPGWKKTREIPEKVEERPVLSKIPLLNRLVQKKIPGRTENDVVLIVVTQLEVITGSREAVASVRGPHPADQPMARPAVVRATYQDELADVGVQANNGMKLEAILARYRDACARQDRFEAGKLARQALAIDPLCFMRNGRSPNR